MQHHLHRTVHHRMPAALLACFLALCTSTTTARAQLVTQDLTEGLTPTQLAQTLVGPGVVISNVQFSGVPSSAGRFSGGTGILGFANGIVLSSGCISNIKPTAGQNYYNDVTCDNAQPGDVDLDALIPGYTTHDRCVLEFDFHCTTLQVISFEYVFSSDEYNEYANTAFNDVFGFFVNGVNVALLPDGVTPVSINNVNCGNPEGDPTPHHCQYYINNSCQGPPGTPTVPFPCAPSLQTEMDGMTVVLTVFTPVLSGTNHIKLAIADAGDHILDSNVFIRTQSFTCTPPGTTGACCLPNGMCTDETSADCAEDGGVFHPNVSCKTFNCACPADVTIDGIVNVNDLLTVINNWGPCPVTPVAPPRPPAMAQELGACCFSDGTCDNQTAADCADNGGVFHPGEDCDFYQCPAATPCSGDITGDLMVNVNDLLAVINAWGPCP